MKEGRGDVLFNAGYWKVWRTCPIVINLLPYKVRVLARLKQDIHSDHALHGTEGKVALGNGTRRAWHA